MIHIIIADDHALVRDGYRAPVTRATDIEVVGEARDGREAVALAAKLSSDVVLMDIYMPHVNGLEASQRIAAESPITPVLLVAMSCDEALLFQALQYGVRGYLSKSDLFQELVPAIRALHEGKTYFSVTISTQHADHIAKYQRSVQRQPLRRFAL